MLILTINDGERNGKLDKNNTDNYLNTNFKFCISDCVINKNSLIVENNNFDLSNISTVIFNFNEDLLTFKREWNKIFKRKFKTVEDMINNFKEISDFIKKFHPNIVIYNDPNICFELGNKVLVFDRIKNVQDDLIKVPEYKKILTEYDLITVDFFPCIIKVTNGSNSKDDTVCKTNEELLKVYNNNFKNKENIFVVEFIDSYIQELDCRHSIRFMVTNNNIMEYYFRGSKNWNIHTNSQISSKIKECDLFYDKIYKIHKPSLENYFNKIYKIYGNGFYAYDIIYNEKQNKYYICELGLKIFDYTFCNYSSKYIDKLSFDKNNLKKYYKNQILKTLK